MEKAANKITPKAALELADVTDAVEVIISVGAEARGTGSSVGAETGGTGSSVGAETGKTGASVRAETGETVGASVPLDDG